MLNSDWSQRYESIDAVQTDLGMTVSRIGWYHKKGDTLLVIEEYSGYRVHVWHQVDALEMLKRLVGYTVHS